MRRTRFRQWSLAAGTLFLCALSLLAAEAASRAFLPVPARAIKDDKYPLFLSENAEPFFRVERREGARILTQSPTVGKSVQGQVFRLPKPPGVRRILVVGESSADILGFALRTLIQRNQRAREFEIMNCAVGGGSLEMAENRFDECAKMAPDAVVVLFGHNLFYRHVAASWARQRAARLLRRSRLILWFAERAERRDLETAFTSEVRLRALDRVLRKIARECRRQKVPLILGTLPSNLWFPPQPKADDLYAVEFMEAQRLHDVGRLREAIELLLRAVGRKPSALWHFTVGDWLYHDQGDYRGAYEQLASARDLDPSRERAGTAVNDLIRRVAADERAPLFDAERLIRESAPHGIAGWETFRDPQHVKMRGFESWGADVLRLLAERGGVAAKGGWLLSPPASEPDLPLNRDFKNIVAMCWWGKTWLVHMALHRPADVLKDGEAAVRSLWHDPAEQSDALLQLAEALWRSGLHRQALAFNETAARLAPTAVAPPLQRGRFFLREGERASAFREFGDAAAGDPRNPEAAFFLASERGVHPATLLDAEVPAPKSELRKITRTR